MAPGRRTGWDGLALVASLPVVIAGAGYLWLMDQQEDQPVLWFLAALVVGLVLALYGAATAAPLRTAALTVSGAVLVALGFVGLLSIGLPVLVAGALLLTAGVRSHRRVRL